MLVVKNTFVGMILLFSTAVVSYAQTVREVRKNVTSDGEYVGLERMPNLTPEDRDTEWFHENTLLIRNDDAILDKKPITIRHGSKEYSAADGGFLTYRARFAVKDGQIFVALRLFESMYIIFPRDKHDQYTEIKTYPVRFVSGQIEINGVRYRRTVLDKMKLDRLVRLLWAEPLEKTSTGQ